MTTEDFLPCPSSFTFVRLGVTMKLVCDQADRHAVPVGYYHRATLWRDLTTTAPQRPAEVLWDDVAADPG